MPKKMVAHPQKHSKILLRAALWHDLKRCSATGRPLTSRHAKMETRPGNYQGAFHENDRDLLLQGPRANKKLTDKRPEKKHKH